MLIIMVILEAILFGLFTSCMMLDQWTVVSTNVTSIDKLKGARAPVGGEAAFNEVCGGRAFPAFRWDYLLPSAVDYPSDLQIDFFGYCQPINGDNNDGEEEHELEILAMENGQKREKRKTANDKEDIHPPSTSVSQKDD